MALSVNAERYLREAEKCRRLAASAADEHAREQWTLLAGEYDQLVGSVDALAFMRRSEVQSPGT